MDDKGSSLQPHLLGYDSKKGRVLFLGQEEAAPDPGDAPGAGVEGKKGKGKNGKKGGAAPTFTVDLLHEQLVAGFDRPRPFSPPKSSQGASPYHHHKDHPPGLVVE